MTSNDFKIEYYILVLLVYIVLLGFSSYYYEVKKKRENQKRVVNKKNMKKPQLDKPEKSFLDISEETVVSYTGKPCCIEFNGLELMVLVRVLSRCSVERMSKELSFNEDELETLLCSIREKLFHYLSIDVNLNELGL